VDMSANTGHHLGPSFPPSQLRTVRRALLVRIIRMLTARYRYGRRWKQGLRKDLDEFVRRADLRASAFVSMNWDTVLEETFTSNYPDLDLFYGVGIQSAKLPESGDTVTRASAHGNTRLKIVKMHGSVNWMYCDNCRRTFSFPPRQSRRISDRLLSARDLEDIRNVLSQMGRSENSFRLPEPGAWHCYECQGVALGTRLATFSYRKALDFPMFQTSWRLAEQYLREASRWVFFGYSLPGADFEFKHLLKRIELSRNNPPEVVLITGGDAAKKTEENYRRLFGNALKQAFTQGLDSQAKDFLFSNR
jgi:hypothetical protein